MIIQLLNNLYFIINNDIMFRMKNRKRILFTIICVALMYGCVSVKTKSYVASLQPAQDNQSLPFVDVNDLRVPYRVIGYIEIKSSDVYEAESIMRTMQKKARAMGGDAISDLVQEPIPKRFPFFFDYLNFYNNKWSAEVIVWDSNSSQK